MVVTSPSLKVIDVYDLIYSASAYPDVIPVDEPSKKQDDPRKKKEVINFDEQLEECESYQDVFDLVKKGVKKVIRRWRVGLMLALEDLPLKIGAYHIVGSNWIIINRRLLEIVQHSKIKKEVNSYLFLILMHEYLHSLGLTDEREVRSLTYRIAQELFGNKHPITYMALKGPAVQLGEADMRYATSFKELRDPELIPDFERTSRSYIS